MPLHLNLDEATNNAQAKRIAFCAPPYVPPAEYSGTPTVGADGALLRSEQLTAPNPRKESDTTTLTHEQCAGQIIHHFRAHAQRSGQGPDPPARSRGPLPTRSAPRTKRRSQHQQQESHWKTWVNDSKHPEAHSEHLAYITHLSGSQPKSLTSAAT